MIRVEGLRVAGITRVRNEADIIQDTLDYMADFCSEGIFVYDDASTDETAEICEAHPAVKEVIHRPVWDGSRSGRQAAEGKYRMEVYSLAMKSVGPDWIYCFDADERPELDLNGVNLDRTVGIRLRLFDFYITPEDQNKPWNFRTWIGPEYRDILMMFRAQMVESFMDREPLLKYGNQELRAGFVKHYGKAKSVHEWEETCNYYGNHLPEPYRSKWLSRKGKAVKHDYCSDFGSNLIKWDDREEKGFLLTGNIEARERRRR